MSSSSSPVGSPPVIPPIITNERDRQFLVQLNNYIDRELRKVNEDDAQQRYTVYKASFDRIIDHVTAYKPLLTAIKAEYEDCIDTILRGQKEAVFLTGKLKSMASEPSTIRNYRMRADELEQKLFIIKDDNVRLQRQLQSLRKARIEKARKAQDDVAPPKPTVKKDRRIIPGLTTEESTDMQLLQDELARLEKTVKDLSLSQRTRYTPKNIKNSLKEQLSVKVNHRDMLQEQIELLKAKRHRLKIAVEAANSWMKLQPPHQTIGDAVVIALSKSSHSSTEKAGAGEENVGIPQGAPNTTFEEDDPAREKEAELMLEYIEKFNELLEDGKYEEAAIHAANSPKGILRTPETLQRFKDLKNKTNFGRTPLLAFCDALMASVLALGVRPSEFMSLECVKCALSENRLDLLTHWLSQNRLTVTEILGNMIFDYCKKKSQWTGQGIALAQKVYEEVGIHKKVVDCMMRQGRINQALEYARNKALFSREEYIELLKQHPGPTFAHELYQHKEGEKSLLPLGQIVSTLLQTDVYDVGLQLLQSIFDKGPHGKKETSTIRQDVFDDQFTTSEQWLDIVQSCQDNGYDEVALELLAAVTVLNIMKQAAKDKEKAEQSSGATTSTQAPPSDLSKPNYFSS